MSTILPISLFASNKLTIGVTDETGKNPLKNATVTVKDSSGTLTTGITDNNGFLYIPIAKVKDLNDTVVEVTNVSYQDAQVGTGGKNFVLVKMKPAPKEESEVIVTGKKKVSVPAPAKKNYKPVILIAGGVALAGIAFWLIRKSFA